jgi:NADPH-dependent curcumin reductase CurA
MIANRRFTLVRRPHGTPVPEDFLIDAAALPALGAGEILIRNVYASLDPAIRGWLDDAPSYMPPVRLGDAVRATTVGRVEASRNADYALGDWVMGLNGIETHSVSAPGGFLMKIDPALTGSATHYLSALGAVGLTAYFGLTEVARPLPGQTVLVTGAAGAVGSLAGQMARIMGCRTVGIAGGTAKCARLIEDYGYDAAIDYRGLDAESLAARIRQAAPDGVDAIFENVGGTILDAGLLCLNHGARVALCGLISEYNSPDGKIGTRNIWQLVVQSASIVGFLIRDFLPRFGEGAEVVARWMAEGRLRVDEHIDHGLENAYPAFMRLFDGTNRGKMILCLETGHEDTSPPSGRVTRPEDGDAA